MHSNLFGDDFIWGVSASAAQTEGAYLTDGKGLSIWDVFSAKKNKIRNNDNTCVACDFYNNYENRLPFSSNHSIKLIH